MLRVILFTAAAIAASEAVALVAWMACARIFRRPAPRRPRAATASPPAAPKALPEAITRRVVASELRRLGVVAPVPVGPVPLWPAHRLDRPRFGATWGAA